MSERRARLLVAAAVASAAVLWLPALPLGVPGEWTWNRVPADPARRAEQLLGVLLAMGAAAVYLLICRLGAERIATAGRTERAGWLAALAAGGFAWLWIVQDSPLWEFGLSKAPRVLYYPSSSGYYTLARDIGDVAAFLRGYEALMAQGDVLHIGTHPPGLILILHRLLWLCRQCPGVAHLVLETQPAGVRESFEVIAAHAPLPAADQAALWLAALLVQLLAAATVVPLYALVCRDWPRRTAWQCAAFWPLVPALAVFLPKSDALYPFVGVLLLLTWIQGHRRGSPLLCFGAGVIFWLGLFCSLAMLPVGVLAALVAALGRPWPGEAARSAFPAARRTLLRFGKTAAWAAAGFLVPTLVMWIAWDLNLVRVWAWNYRNHAAFYAQYERTYWKWLVVNPLELTLAAGAPLCVLVLSRYAQLWKQAGDRFSPAAAPCWACAAVWGLLWLSGKNMGEAARLWLFLMPWCPWLAAGALEPAPSRADNASRGAESAGAQHAASGGCAPSSPLWLPALILQAAVTVATVTRVFGFDAAAG